MQSSQMFPRDFNVFLTDKTSKSKVRHVDEEASVPAFRYLKLQI